MNEYWLQGFIKRAAERGLTLAQAEGLLKQAGLGSSLKTLGTLGLGAGGALGAVAAADGLEDLNKTDGQFRLEQMMEQSEGMDDSSRAAYLANYLKDIMRQQATNAKDIYNL